MNPSKMQKLDAEADQLIKNMQTAEETPAEQVTDPVEAEQQPEQVEQNTDQGVVAEETVADSQPQESDEINRLKAELDKSEQRYKSLMGMINKRDGENESLRQLVAQLSQKVEGLSKSPEIKSESRKQLVTKEDEDTFGGDLVDMVRRAAEEIAERKFASLKGEVGGELGKLSDQVNTVAEVTVKSERERLDDALTARVPDWQQINLDEGFIDFLKSNYWLETLNAAYQRGDVNTTAEFFKRYKEATGKTDAAAKPAASADKYVAPGKPKSSPTPASTAGKIWTPADINKLYDDQDRGRISNEEFNRLEADMFKAQRENRFAA